MPFTPSPAFVQVAPSDLGAITNAAYRTWGLGATATPFVITPQTTGRLLVIVAGDLVGTNGATSTIQLRQGTGTAAAHDAADSGNAIGSQVTCTLLTGILTVPFCLVAIISGLTVPVFDANGKSTAAVTVWLDVAVKASASTVTLTNLDCTAVEL